jgi:hypothetical protein
MTDTGDIDYRNAAQIDPSKLAEQLPNRPLQHSEVADLADSLAWSVSTVSYETADGTEYIPLVQMFRHQGETETGWRGDACVLLMDDAMREWDGHVEKADITHKKWTKAVELYAEYMGAETGVISAVRETEDGLERLDFEDPDNIDETR